MPSVSGLPEPIRPIKWHR